ncbi:MAG: C39 family peptidase [Chloroflexi bacterium]|nr:C39 family peptidase [Chloroflexota bacterium]
MTKRTPVLFAALSALAVLLLAVLLLRQAGASQPVIARVVQPTAPNPANPYAFYTPSPQPAAPTAPTAPTAHKPGRTGSGPAASSGSSAITLEQFRRPTASPTPGPIVERFSSQGVKLPLSAEIDGIYGYSQQLPLSCESRSAADWARYFGIEIDELDFMNRLPQSSNPEEGFVGSPYGSWGQIPPGSYGVHAAPVAALLREYGAQAQAVKNLPFEDLLAEIASGRPVIVWVTGHVEPGEGVPYEIAGEVTTVARYEHTVIITGYDSQSVIVLDGKDTYRRNIDTFLQSWGALENMAVLWQE